MKAVFSFEGRIRRGAYLPAAIAAGLIPYLIAPVLWAVSSKSDAGVLWQVEPSPWLFIAPARWAIVNARTAPLLTDFLALLAVALTVLGGWIGAALATRRARDAGVSDAYAALALTPVVQWLLVAVLACLPSRIQAEPEKQRPASGPARGLLIGIGIAVLAVAVGALVYKTYGFMLFVSTPFLVGFAVAFERGRRDPEGRFSDAALATTKALTLGGLALLVFALEGFICILMAAPLAWAAGVIGATFGHGAARLRRGPPTLTSLAALPLLLIGQQAMAPSIVFSDTRSVEVAAPPKTVWRAVIRMERIKETPAAPFRLGVTYPLSGEVEGEGVGAIRRGHFSTGDAVERVTEWKPERALGFVILSEPPVMRELSPYPNMTTPHVDGYFRSVDARIVLEPLAGDRTRLTLETRHALDLQPGSYWLPFTRWIVHQNKARVLGQMRRQAEADPGV
jgi:uncharacterized membrane protein YhaH (DUF805 family)